MSTITYCAIKLKSNIQGKPCHNAMQKSREKGQKNVPEQAQQKENEKVDLWTQITNAFVVKQEYASCQCNSYAVYAFLFTLNSYKSSRGRNKTPQPNKKQL